MVVSATGRHFDNGRNLLELVNNTNEWYLSTTYLFELGKCEDK